MEAVMPWAALLSLVAPYYSKGATGRKPVGLAIMLRVYFLQQWFALWHVQRSTFFVYPKSVGETLSHGSSTYSPRRVQLMLHRAGRQRIVVLNLPLTAHLLDSLQTAEGKLHRAPTP
jgi:hypothetical protein